MKLRTYENKRIYILHIREYIYGGFDELIGPYEPILIKEYVTIAQTKNGKKLKDVFNNKKYHYDFSMLFGLATEVSCLKEIEDIYNYETKEDLFNYLKEYVKVNKEEIQNNIKKLYDNKTIMEYDEKSLRRILK